MHTPEVSAENETYHRKVRDTSQTRMHRTDQERYGKVFVSILLCLLFGVKISSIVRNGIAMMIDFEN